MASDPKATMGELWKLEQFRSAPRVWIEASWVPCQ